MHVNAWLSKSKIKKKNRFGNSNPCRVVALLNRQQLSDEIEESNFPITIGQSKLLSWTHYNLLLDVSNDEPRAWYADEA